MRRQAGTGAHLEVRKRRYADARVLRQSTYADWIIIVSPSRESRAGGYGCWQVFISHSSADIRFVDRLVADLRAVDVPVWYDKLDLQVGDSFPDRINEGLSSARYFAFVMTPSAMNSRWVHEELDAALLEQTTAGGAFLLLLFVQDCSLPPLLAHRRYAYFPKDYQAGLQELLATWDLDAEACGTVNSTHLFPWPDEGQSDRQFVCLHSRRFDKFFRMGCSLSWSTERTIEYLVEPLALPLHKDIPELATRWSFSYGLVFDGEAITPKSLLSDVAVEAGSALALSIRSAYEDLLQPSVPILSGGPAFYNPVHRTQPSRNKQFLDARGPLTQTRLNEIVDSYFAHLRVEFSTG